MIMSNIIIRKATSNDIANIVQVHVECWQETYTDLLPISLMNGNNIEKRQHIWTNFFTDSAHKKAFVACTDGHIVGFCSWVEIDQQINLLTFYVLRSFHEQKIGTKLMNQVLKAAAKRQIPIHLWVLKTNHKARLFYEKLGFNHVQDKNLEENYPDVIDSLYVFSSY